MRALVSGGNRGIGLEVCRIILENAPGAHVFLGCRDLEAGRELANELSKAAPGGGRAQAVQLDVASEDSITRAVSSIAPPLDLLVNNAGILHETFDAKTAAATMKTNFDGVVALTTACIPLLEASPAPGGAQVLVTSSGMGARILGLMSETHRNAFTSPTLELPELRALLAQIMEDLCKDPSHPYHAQVPTVAYSLSKLGVNSYTQILSRQHPQMRFHACSPGFTNTGMCANYTGSRKPKDVALGASVFTKVLFGEKPLGAGSTGVFFKESSKAGTPLAQAMTAVDPWVQ